MSIGDYKQEESKAIVVNNNALWGCCMAGHLFYVFCNCCCISGGHTAFVFVLFLWFLSHYAVVLCVSVSRPMFSRLNVVTPISHITGDRWIWQMTFLCVGRAQVKWETQSHMTYKSTWMNIFPAVLRLGQHLDRYSSTSNIYQTGSVQNRSQNI